MADTPNTRKPVTAELSANGEHVLVTFDYNPAFVKAVKRVPSARFRGKDKPDGPAWRLNLDLPTMRKLREAFGDDLALGDRLREWGVKETATERTLSDLSDANDADLESEHLAKLVKGVKVNGKRLKLRPYQKADIAFMAETNVINANQPRTGKTIETVGALIEAGLEWGQHVVFAPKASLRNVWEDGIKETYEAAGLDEPVVLTGDTPDSRREAIKEAVALAEEGYAFWLVLNPAMARMVNVRTLNGEVISKTAAKKLAGRDLEKLENEKRLANPGLIEVDWDGFVVDEFHLCGLSNPNTQTAEGLNHIAEATQPTKRFALSGTPMGGKPVKLWGALNFLDPEKFTSRWHWARHWLVINTNGYGSTIEGIMPGREDEFYRHLKPYLVRRTQRDALPGLPPRQVVEVWCHMTPQQEEQYRTMATEAEWIFEDLEEEGRLSTPNMLSMYTRLKQFADGYCDVAKTGKEVNGIPQLRISQTEDSGKLEQLIEKLEEENVIVKGDDDDDPKCAVVFSQFNDMVNMVHKALEDRGVPCAKLTGKTTDKERDRLVRAFQAGGKDAPRVMVMNTLAGGSAITLDRAETVHMLDETWVPDNQEQAENRITPTTKERMKRANIGVYYYRTRGTIEEYIQKLVADKAMNNKTILDLRRRMQEDLRKAEEASEEEE